MQDFKDFKATSQQKTQFNDTASQRENQQRPFTAGAGEYGQRVEKGAGAKQGNANINPELLKMIGAITSKYNGASEKELWQAIYQEAKKGYKNGTLKERDIDTFASMVAPMLDGKKRAKLYEIVEKLKKSGRE